MAAVNALMTAAAYLTAIIAPATITTAAADAATIRICHDAD
jgi:hypothetical protein